LACAVSALLFALTAISEALIAAFFALIAAPAASSALV